MLKNMAFFVFRPGNSGPPVCFGVLRYPERIPIGELPP